MSIGENTRTAVASVIIPAHNEARVVERTLHHLLDGLSDPLDVVVVCNGCSDDTAAIARRVPGVRVLEIPEPSKRLAVAAGNRATDVFPRLHLDADVELSGSDVLALIAPLERGDVLATAPARVVPLSRSGRLVRAYYRVWRELPHVQAGLFGRGAIALSEAGQSRVSALPAMMGDDLGMSEAFETSERAVVERARVVVHPPVTVRDLVRRRTRVATGNAQAGSLAVRRADSVTTPLTLGRLAVRRPLVGLQIPVFVAVTILARLGARRAVRRGDFTTWLRDESSRA